MPPHYVSGVEIELLASSSTIQDPNETERLSMSKRLTGVFSLDGLQLEYKRGLNPLQTTLMERGTVSGRVALLLRSTEVQP